MTETLTFPIIVVGAGGTGLCAALAAREAGLEVLVIERDAKPFGSTGMSTGLIPAAGTQEQRDAGIVDDPHRFAADIMAKTGGRTDATMAHHLAEHSATTMRWLRDGQGVPLTLVDGFTYAGHSARRMYGTPNRTGAELMAALESAAETAGVIVLTQAQVIGIEREDDRVTGVRIRRPDGREDQIGCAAVILACSGFGGDPDLVAQWMPEMAGAVYHGHPGNRGDALHWGIQFGAAVADMHAYQGHGGLAVGHGVPILWPLIMEGGIQVNSAGRRFSNEARGYSEQAASVNAQDGHVAWSVFDDRLHRLMLDFEDYRVALAAGAIVEAPDLLALAKRIKLPGDTLIETVTEVERCARGEADDIFGRNFRGKPPYAGAFRAAKVTGALFHTQGGLVIDGDGRVLRESGTSLPNLFAGGGAARGISGDGADGYLAGNGLLTATTLGRLAGAAAARQILAGA